MLVMALVPLLGVVAALEVVQLLRALVNRVEAPQADPQRQLGSFPYHSKLRGVWRGVKSSLQAAAVQIR